MMNIAQHQAEEMRKHACEASQFIHSDEHKPNPSVDEFALTERRIVEKLEGLGGNRPPDPKPPTSNVICDNSHPSPCPPPARYTKGGAMWENASSHTDAFRAQWASQCEKFTRDFFTFGKQQGCLVGGLDAAEAWLTRIDEAMEVFERRDCAFGLAISMEARSAREERHARRIEEERQNYPEFQAWSNQHRHGATLRKGSVLNLRAPVSLRVQRCPTHVVHHQR